MTKQIKYKPNKPIILYTYLGRVMYVSRNVPILAKSIKRLLTVTGYWRLSTTKVIHKTYMYIQFV